MKRFLLIFALVFSMFVDASSHFEKKIVRHVQPYKKAALYLTSLDQTVAVKEDTCSDFFNRFGLYKKNDKKRFERSFRIIKRLAEKKNLNQDQRDQVNIAIDTLKIVQKFIYEYASTHYAGIVYSEIEAVYHQIDEQNDEIAYEIIEKPWLLNLSVAKDRGLYHFVKKIDLDIRRLTALLTQSNVAIDSMVKIDQLVRKITLLKYNIMETSVYKAQLRKTRWLKACGIVFVPMMFFVPIILLYATVAPITAVLSIPTMIVAAPVLGIFYASFFAAIVTTIQDIKEARKYEIPLHARSLFSLVAWQGWLIQAAIRIPFIVVTCIG